MTLPEVHLVPLLPVLFVTGLAFLVLILDLFLSGSDREVLAWPSVVGLAIAGIGALVLWGSPPTDTLASSFRLDNYALFFDVILCLGSAIALLMSVEYLETTGIRTGDYYTLALFATAGMMLMAGANDLVVVFLGLEVMSVAVYVLAGIQRDSLRSNEAALKYFLLGAFATGFLLFGIALVYGATGTTRLDLIAERIASAASGENRALLLPGVVLLLVGFGFKVAAVPFHVWTPDVYEGAPTSVTAFMAVGVKAAAFAAFGRVFLSSLAGIADEWRWLVAALAVATMTLGNLLAISQSNIKRMLAYSSIAHAGYLLVALVAGGTSGGSALLFYLLAYGLMNLGAFAVVIALAKRGETSEEIERFAGLGFRHPALGAAMGVFLLSLAGVPPFVGFVGKLYLFSAAVSEGWVVLAVIGVLNSVVSAYYYIWVIVVMYMREGNEMAPALSARPYVATAIGVALAGTVGIGLFPGPFLALARSGFSILG
jgi:NADH-quinone oxidoreductase subunit N